MQTAQTNLDQVKIQQDTLVKNARRNLLNTNFTAISDLSKGAYNSTSYSNPPTISGSYSKDEEGEIYIKTYNSNGGRAFETTGLVESSGIINSSEPKPIGDSGLYISLTDSQSQGNWIIQIPNKQSSQYIQNFNSYQSALTTRDQAVANATALLNQAKANLTAKQASARPEDVAIAKAQVDSATGVL